MSMRRRLKGLLEDTVYRKARFFSVWELKEMVQRILGPTHVRWNTALFFPVALIRLTRPVERHPVFQQNPCGAFIVMTVDICYRFVACKDHVTTPLQPTHGQMPQGTLKVFSFPPVRKEKQPPEAMLHP
jgi:hypothetical protein